jgi:hypothetical protein
MDLTEFSSKMILKLLWNILFLVQGQGQFQVHRINLHYYQNNRKGRLSDKNISNYGSIMYLKVTRKQKWSDFTGDFCSLAPFQYIIDP